MTQTLTLDIPNNLWMSSNDRMHWAERARRTKQIRTLAGWRARELEPVRGIAAVTVFVGYPPRARRLDPANAYPCVKAAIDGITDRGIWPDDSDDHLIGPDMRRDGSTGTPGLHRLRIVIVDQHLDF